MFRHEQVLLENLLDSLDRLFDRDSRPIDVYALLYATTQALDGSEFQAQIEPFIDPLLAVVRGKYTPEQRRDAALIVTDDLRGIIGKDLPMNEKLRWKKS